MIEYENRLNELDAPTRDLLRARYEACHPEDTFADLLRRAHFVKEDKGLLRDWLAAVERTTGERLVAPPLARAA